MKISNAMSYEVMNVVLFVYMMLIAAFPNVAWPATSTQPTPHPTSTIPIDYDVWCAQHKAGAYIGLVSSDTGTWLVCQHRMWKFTRVGVYRRLKYTISWSNAAMTNDEVDFYLAAIGMPVPIRIPASQTDGLQTPASVIPKPKTLYRQLAPTGRDFTCTLESLNA